jgi:hypothetical protein
MKLCKDCKHCETQKSWLGDKTYYCHAFKTEEIDLVTGEIVIRGWKNLCWTLREDTQSCGALGRNWEAK